MYGLKHAARQAADRLRHPEELAILRHPIAVSCSEMTHASNLSGLENPYEATLFTSGSTWSRCAECRRSRASVPYAENGKGARYAGQGSMA